MMAAILKSAARELQLLLAYNRQSSTKALPRVVDVTICGAGPTGLTAGIWLAQHGVSCVVLDKSAQLTRHPQAHYVNNRTMELFRGIPAPTEYASGKDDSLAAVIDQLSPPLNEWRRFRYVDRLVGGQVLGDVDHFRGQAGPCMRQWSPEPVAHLSQNRLLPLLLSSASRFPDLCTVAFGHKVESMQQDSSGVSTLVNGPSSACTVRSRFAIACDGAGSPLRGQLGVGLEGREGLQSLINVHFSSPALAAALQRTPAMLYFVYARTTVLVLVAHDLSSGDFVAQIPFFPPVQHPADFTEAACRDMLTAAAGVPLPDATIHTIRPWSMHAQVADRFRVGNVFLAGDAAHRFPPAGGFGMNTGVQDAHNLAWKLAAMLQKAGCGGAPGNYGCFPAAEPSKSTGVKGGEVERVLQSYEEERRPVAVANTALSIANWEETLKVPAAIGLPPDAAAALQAASAQLPDASAQSSARRAAAAVLGASLRTAYAAAGLHGPFAEWRRAELRSIFDSGTTLQLQFPAEDLGFSYPAVSSAQPPHSTHSTRRTSSSESIDAAVARTKAARQARAVPPGRTAGARGGVGAAGGAEAAGGFRPRLQVGGRLPHFELVLRGSTADVASVAVHEAMHEAQHASTSTQSTSSKHVGVSAHVSSIDLPNMCRGRVLRLVCIPSGSWIGAGGAADSTPIDDLLPGEAGRGAQGGAVLVVVVLSGSGTESGVAKESPKVKDVLGIRMPVDAGGLRAFAAEHGTAPVWLATGEQGQVSALTGGRAVGIEVRPDGHISSLSWENERP